MAKSMRPILKRWHEAHYENTAVTCKERKDLQGNACVTWSASYGSIAFQIDAYVDRAVIVVGRDRTNLNHNRVLYNTDDYDTFQAALEVVYAVTTVWGNQQCESDQMADKLEFVLDRLMYLYGTRL